MNSQPPARQIDPSDDLIFWFLNNPGPTVYTLDQVKHSILSTLASTVVTAVGSQIDIHPVLRFCYLNSGFLWRRYNCIFGAIDIAENYTHSQIQSCSRSAPYHMDLLKTVPIPEDTISVPVLNADEHYDSFDITPADAPAEFRFAKIVAIATAEAARRSLHH